MKSKDLTKHLTDEQFGELLAGEFPDEPARAHLAGCDFCRGEVEAVRGSVDAFNTVTMDWAAMEAPRRVPVPSRLALRLGGRPMWGLGLAATAAGVVVAFGMTLPYTQRPAPAPAKAVLKVPTNDELAEDNRLMQSINQELRYEVQPAVPAAELRLAARQTERRGTATVAN